MEADLRSVAIGAALHCSHEAFEILEVKILRRDTTSFGYHAATCGREFSATMLRGRSSCLALLRPALFACRPLCLSFERSWNPRDMTNRIARGRTFSTRIRDCCSTSLAQWHEITTTQWTPTRISSRSSV